MDSVDSSCHLYKRLPVRHAMLPVRASTVCFAAYMVQSDPGPHYRKMSKLLVLLQLRFQT